MTPLPRLMVAPNGARHSKADHPALPITDAELITTARSCHKAGADGLHIHIRDAAGAHLLDAERYRDLVARLGDTLPDLYLQVTSEAAGLYSAVDQQEMMRALRPRYVSVALREMVRSADDWAAARDFYHWARDEGVEIQHILYAPADVTRFAAAIDETKIPGTKHAVLFVQGSYANGSKDSIAIDHYLTPLKDIPGAEFDWMVCAFGADETQSLVQAAKMGGKARAGFENSFWNQDGSLAKDNAERVAEVDLALRTLAR